MKNETIAMNAVKGLFQDAKRDTIMNVTLGLLVVTLLGLCGPLYVASRSIIAQLGGEPRYAAAIVRKVAEGDLSVNVDLRAGDATSLLAAMRDMVSKLSHVVAEVKANAEQIAGASGQVSSTAQSLSQAVLRRRRSA